MWKTIKRKSNYEVNKAGQIRNKKTGRILKNSIRKDGYCQVMLGRKTIPEYIHRLVAETFIPNPKKLPQVDHINGVKSDNRIENLRWVDATENYMSFGYKSRICNKWKTVKALLQEKLYTLSLEMIQQNILIVTNHKLNIIIYTKKETKRIGILN